MELIYQSESAVVMQESIFHFFQNVFKAGPEAIDPITIIYNQVSHTLVAAVYSSYMKNKIQHNYVNTHSSIVQ